MIKLYLQSSSVEHPRVATCHDYKIEMLIAVSQRCLVIVCRRVEMAISCRLCGVEQDALPNAAAIVEYFALERLEQRVVVPHTRLRLLAAFVVVTCDGPPLLHLLVFCPRLVAVVRVPRHLDTGR